MSKKLLYSYLLTGSVLSGSIATAQTAALLSQTPLPFVTGAVVKPQNAGNSTLQKINFMGAAGENLYVHSWDDVNSGRAGIAWRRTNATGVLQDEGYLPLTDVNDIDVALYQSGTKYFVLAAYYYDDGTTKGHYYDIYNFTPTGLTSVSTMNLLTSTPSFGRINVDANPSVGLAITWAHPGLGIYVKVAKSLGTPTFAPNVLLPGSLHDKDPDICILSNGPAPALHIALLSDTETDVKEQSLDFATAVSGTATGLTTEYNQSTGAAFCSPRIDGQDKFLDNQWTMVFSEYTYAGTLANERIIAAVFNSAWSPVPTTVPVHSASYSSHQFSPNNPVVAYNPIGDTITVGWITRDVTTVLTADESKYVAQYIRDAGTSAPTSLPASYMMISNNEGGDFPVLAFSGQNTMSNYSGLHTVYNLYNSLLPGNDCMVYKNKAWSSNTFKMAQTAATATLSLAPNPFSNTLDLTLPAKGHYLINITGIDGRSVYNAAADFEAMQRTRIQTDQLHPGIYFIQVTSPEQQISYTQKIQKQ